MGFIKLNDLEQKEIVPGYRVRFVHSEQMTTAYWEVTAGAELPLHSHMNEQVSNVTEGEFEFNLNGDTRILRPGDVVVIPSNIPHSGKAVTNCRIIDTFYPVREDYK
ncbi:MAG: cupin domain-containing protein [Acidobacteriota bacterium]